MQYHLSLKIIGINEPWPENLTVLTENIQDQLGNLEYFKSLLSKEETDQVDKFVFEQGKLRYLINHGRLREVLSHSTGIPAKNLAYTFSKKGKPALLNNILFFNLSNSEDYFSIATSKQFEVGVDIESLYKKPDVMDIMESYYSEREIKFVKQENELKRKLINFLIVWTRKEAILKLSGEGIIVDLPQLCTCSKTITIKPIQKLYGNHIKLITKITDDTVVTVSYCNN